MTIPVDQHPENAANIYAVVKVSCLVWTEALEMYLLDCIHCAAATWLSWLDNCRIEQMERWRLSAWVSMSRCFIMVRVTMNPEPIQYQEHWHDYILNGTPVHCRAPCTHTMQTHSFTPIPSCFFKVWGNLMDIGTAFGCRTDDLAWRDWFIIYIIYISCTVDASRSLLSALSHQQFKGAHTFAHIRIWYLFTYNPDTQATKSNAYRMNAFH